RSELDDKAILWPQPGQEEVVDTLPHGIGHADGRAVFPVPDGSVPGGMSLNSEFPLLLIQGPILQHLGSGARTSRSRRLMKFVSQAALGVHPEDLERLGLSQGQTVKVVSEAGELEVPVRAAPELPAGSVFLPWSFAEARPGRLFAWNWNHGRRGFNIRHCRVRLEKVKASS
ncbi:MAG: molybdopterin dinucleotide binding domain-containing protein, partial [Pseudomonadota bacterium]